MQHRPYDRDALRTFRVEHIQAEKEDAIMVVLVNGDTLWIPKKDIHETSEVRTKGDTGRLVIPQWLATEKYIT